MSYSPLTVGEAPLLTVPWVQDNGQPLDLSEATELVMLWFPAPASPVANEPFTGAGPFNFYQRSGGMTTYQVTPVDTANVGYWLLRPQATFPAGPRFGDLLQLEIQPLGGW